MENDSRERSLPIPVVRAVRKLGQDISAARRRRRIPTIILAERAGINRKTLIKIEKGHPGVLMAHYASVLFALGLVNRLADIADIAHDALGRDLDEETLPKRIRKPRRKSSPESA
jgi:DNA-binding XRE family transcriptional regulator